MSYIKNTIDIDTQMQRLAMARKTEAELRDAAELEALERLKWEVDRAVTNLFEAINRREQRRTAEAVRQIDQSWKDGNPPF